MTLRVRIDGVACTLRLEPLERGWAYWLEGGVSELGQADLAELAPGVFSVLLGHRQIAVYVDLASSGGTGAIRDVWVGGQLHRIAVSDARDRPADASRTGAGGSAEVRAQMPGKVIKLLVSEGDTVESGQGLIVVEAMKMQNEMRSARAGTVSKVYVAEGATVAAGDKLVAVE